MRRRDPRLGQPLLDEQLAQQARVGTIRLRPLLTTALGGRVSRLGQMWLDAGAYQFFGDEPPAGAAFNRERNVVTSFESLQPLAQHWPCCRPNLASSRFAGVGVQIIERDLCSVHVKTAYNCHLGTSSSTRFVH